MSAGFREPPERLFTANSRDRNGSLCRALHNDPYAQIATMRRSRGQDPLDAGAARFLAGTARQLLCIVSAAECSGGLTSADRFGSVRRLHTLVALTRRGDGSGPCHAQAVLSGAVTMRRFRRHQDVAAIGISGIPVPVTAHSCDLRIGVGCSRSVRFKAAVRSPNRRRGRDGHRTSALAALASSRRPQRATAHRIHAVIRSGNRDRQKRVEAV